MFAKSIDSQLEDSERVASTEQGQRPEEAADRPSEIEEKMTRLRELRLSKEADAVRARISKANAVARAPKSRTRFK